MNKILLKSPKENVKLDKIVMSNGAQLFFFLCEQSELTEARATLLFLCYRSDKHRFLSNWGNTGKPRPSFQASI